MAKKKENISSRHLRISLLDEDAADKKAETSVLPEEKHLFSVISEGCRAMMHDVRFDLLEIREKKSDKLLGIIQFNAAANGSRLEINLTMLHPGNTDNPDYVDKYAVEALKKAAKWGFSAHKEVLFIETWLNPDISAIRILEKAGYERVFESDGMIRYEKSRPRAPILAILMGLCTVCGAVIGGIFGNYPLGIILGISVGILPGALADSLLQKRRRQKGNE